MYTLARCTEANTHTDTGTTLDAVGPSDATVAILSIHDIFGFFPQTIQGADLVSASLTNSPTPKPTVVVIPDFFSGNPADVAWYPPDSPEKEAKLNAWFATASPPDHLPKVPGLVTAAEKAYPGIKSWGVLGYCWGAKMGSLLASNQAQSGGSTFRAVVQSSPALIDPSEAAKITIPMMMLASKDELEAEVTAYDKALTQSAKHVETFADQFHGWMSARGDLTEGSKERAEYERGYQLTCQFFYEHL